MRSGGWVQRSSGCEVRDVMGKSEAARRTVHVRVSGRVQGVGFRAFTVACARAFKIDGWVRNRRDGSVEAVISGKPDAIVRMMAQLEVGPGAARVTAFDARDVQEAPASGFEALETA